MSFNQRCKLNRKLWLSIVLLIVFLSAGAVLFVKWHPPVYYLSIYEAQSELVLYQQEVKPGDMFILDYTHSADKTPVKSVFLIEEDNFVLLEEKYSWYGAGLEAGSDYKFTFSEDEVTVSGYNRIFDYLPLRIARTVKQKLKFNDVEVILNDLAPGGTLLLIRVEKQ